MPRFLPCGSMRRGSAQSARRNNSSPHPTRFADAGPQSEGKSAEANRVGSSVDTAGPQARQPLQLDYWSAITV